MVPQGAQDERRRIRAAYARRRQHGRDGAWFGHEDAAHVLRLQQRYLATLQLLAAAGIPRDPARCRVLDLGCGDGAFLLELIQWGFDPRRLAGVDLRLDAAVKVRSRLPWPAVAVACGSALPYGDATFDLVCLLTVVSSIRDPGVRRAVADEVGRVLAPGGAVLWYDTFRRNPRNPDVAPVPAAELRALFPGWGGPVRKLTFLPHLARQLPVPLLELAYPLLAAVPWWRSHHLAVLVKPRN